MTAPPERAFVNIDVHQTGVVIGRITVPSLGPREAPIVEQEVIEAAKPLAMRIALDFTAVQSMGSLALGRLVTLAKACKAADGRLVLFALNEDLRGILRMSRLDALLTITRDEGEAIEKAS